MAFIIQDDRQIFLKTRSHNRFSSITLLIFGRSESRIWKGIIPIHKCSIQNESFSTIHVIIEVDWP
ncbi:MAG: hypothetical protein DBP01_16315 [gamma proteobacterium symbiont of Ctena orbiculata]|nr:MAG: hypothetical protein DBP01_16315 [gamma proteobacterium symbiont of Ctena orbiculata]